MSYRRIIDLGGDDWEIGSVPNSAGRPITTGDVDAVRDWLPATVPGNVRNDLYNAGRIPDPFIGFQNEQSQWIDNHDWWYRKEFSHTLSRGERAFLVFNGIDYLSAIHLDGKLLGCHEGMFSQQVYEITRLLQPPHKHHILLVRIVGPAHFPKRKLSAIERLWRAITTRLPRSHDPFPERLSFLKCQMGFGWDFAPRIRTVGIWDKACMIIVRSVWIGDVRIRTNIECNQAQINLDITVDSDRAQQVSIQIEVREKDTTQAAACHAFDVTLTLGNKLVQTSFVLDRPKLWQPWDHGESHLYNLIVKIVRQEGGSADILDTYEQCFGIREIALAAPEDSPSAEPWSFQINGRPEFIRGANWVPMDALPGRLRKSDYETMLDQVRAAGINMLRVWGGGLREKAAFYDLCDEKGILVWQDFPFACAFLGHYPRQPRYLELVRCESSDIVRQLRNHPSLVLWCGGNEFSAWRNRRLVNILQAAVAGEDGARPFKPVSPGRGETHNWRIWHGQSAVSHYRRERATFLAEFGLQAIPDVDTLKQFLTEKGLWPPGDEWTYHNAELDKLFRYARPLLPPDIDSLERLLEQSGPYQGRHAGLPLLETFVAASQQAQANGLQVAIEHIRRRKGKTGGVLLWQFNEPWPAICWSIIDYYRRPKSGYHKVAQIYNPVLLSVLYPLKPYEAGETLEFELWGINDLIEPVKDSVAEVTLDGETILKEDVTLPPNSSLRLAQVTHTLNRTPQNLSTRLSTQSGEVISTNEYDLTYHQSPEVIWKEYLFSRLVELTIKW